MSPISVIARSPPQADDEAIPCNLLISRDRHVGLRPPRDDKHDSCNSLYRTMNKISIHMIRAYQRFLSPMTVALGTQCRFYPSCSEYAAEVFERLPWWRACFLTGKRLLKCGPWSEGGMDKFRGS